MTPGLLGALVGVGGFALGAVIAWRVAVRSGLRLAHPGIAFLVTHGVLFGVGGIALAIVDGRGGPAAYTGGAMAAFAAGLGGSAWLAARRALPVDPGTARGSPPADRVAEAAFDPDPEALDAARAGTVGRVRLAVAALLALGSIALLLPLIARNGLPFLAGDITGARAEIAGLVIQPLRVAAPALAIVLLLRAIAGDRRLRIVAAGAVGAIAVFELLLASRYLLAELAVALGIAWLITGRTIRLRTVAVLALAALVAFAGLQLLRTWDQARGQELEFAVRRTVNRVVLVQPRTLDALMTVIPAEQPHFVGGTWVRRLAPAFGHVPAPNLGSWIYDRVVPGRQTVPGYAAPGLLGEAWANFGWFGLGLFGLLGVAVERFGALLAARRDTEADIAAASIVSLFVARTHALGLVGLGVLVVLAAGWRLVSAPDAGLARAVGRALRWRAPG